MKKITREQIGALSVPVPAVEEQDALSSELEKRMASVGSLQKILSAESDAIGALQAGLLRQAFQGDL